MRKIFPNFFLSVQDIFRNGRMLQDTPFLSHYSKEKLTLEFLERNSSKRLLLLIDVVLSNSSKSSPASPID
jgi:hypothetical protein